MTSFAALPPMPFQAPHSPPAHAGLDVEPIRPAVVRTFAAATVVGTVFVLAVIVVVLILTVPEDGPLRKLDVSLAKGGGPSTLVSATLLASLLAVATAGTMAAVGMRSAIRWTGRRDRPISPAAVASLRRNLVTLRVVATIAFAFGLVGVAVPAQGDRYDSGAQLSSFTVSYSSIPAAPSAVAQAALFVLCGGAGTIVLASRRLAATVAETLSPERRSAFDVVPQAAPRHAGAVPPPPAFAGGPAPTPLPPPGWPPAVRRPADDPLRPWRTLVGALLIATCLLAVPSVVPVYRHAKRYAGAKPWTDLYEAASQVPGRSPGPYGYQSGTRRSPLTGSVAVLSVAGGLTASSGMILLSAWSAACVFGRRLLRRTAVVVAAAVVGGCVVAAIGGVYLQSRFLYGERRWYGPGFGSYDDLQNALMGSPTVWAWLAALPFVTFLLLTQWPSRELFAARR